MHPKNKPKNIEQIIRKKEWSDKHKEHALKVLKEHESKRKKSFSEIISVWTVIIVILLGFVILAIVAAPLLLFFPGLWIYLVIAILAMIFSYLFYYIIEEQELKLHHHIISKAVLPIFGSLLIYNVAIFTNWISKNMNDMFAMHNEFNVSVTFLLAYVLPIVASEAYFNHKKKK